MLSFKVEPIILTNEQKAELASRLQNPDTSYVRELIEQQERIDQIISVCRQGTDVVWDITGLDLTFIDQKMSEHGQSCENHDGFSGSKHYTNISSDVAFTVRYKESFFVDESYKNPYLWQKTESNSIVEYEEQEQMDFAA